MVSEFLKEVVYSFIPLRYKYLSEQKFSKSLAYMSKILFLALIIASIVSIPKISTLHSTIVDELDKFSTFDVDGNITTTAPVTIPRNNPVLIVDLSSPQNISDESFLITRDNVQYRFFGKRVVSVDDLLSPTEHKPVAAGFVSAVMIMFLPSIFLFMYLYLWIKYFILIFLGASIFFTLFELTQWRLKWKQCANIAAHAITIPILLEVISVPIYDKYLIPTIRFLGTYVYIVPLAVYAVIMIIGVIFTYVEAHRGDRPRKRKKK